MSSDAAVERALHKFYCRDRGGSPYKWMRAAMSAHLAALAEDKAAVECMAKAACEATMSRDAKGKLQQICAAPTCDVFGPKCWYRRQKEARAALLALKEMGGSE